MERCRVTRNVRIAITALSLTACMLLAALWVRSYAAIDSLGVSPNIYVSSYRGSLYWSAIYFATKSPPPSIQRWVQSPLIQIYSISAAEFVPVTFPLMPISILVGLFAAISAIPWMRGRFSLRTLLIATTLVAVAPGIIVWSS